MTDWRPGPAWLFCPADRPDRYLKALERSDVVILDLEDAVAPSGKDAARDAIRGLAARGVLDAERTVLRVNAAGTGDHAADLALAAEVTGFRCLMLAKAEHPDDVARMPAAVIPLVESPLGLESAGALARPDNVVAMMWGADDLVAGLGGVASRRPDGSYRDIARFARSRVLVAAKACGRLALDGVHMDIADVAGLRAECDDAVAVGFDATVAIHPTQVGVIRAAYAPDPEAVMWATRLLDTVRDDRSVSVFEGRMVDGPIFKQAERTLHLARAVRTTEDP